MNNLYISYITVIINALSMTAACVMLFFVYKQTQTNQEWNRRKTSEETLTKLVIDEFYTLLNKLTLEYDWDPVNQEKNYSQVMDGMKNDPKMIKHFQVTLRSLLRILETICINIKHNMIEEDICYDYMFSILINIYQKSHKFIQEEREIRNNPHVFEHLEHFAKKWEIRYTSSQRVDS